MSAMAPITLDCPNCNAQGMATQYVCCGMETEFGCCGEPVLEEMPCEVCSTLRVLSLEQFKEYAISKRDRQLITRYEATLLLSQIADQLPASARRSGRL